MASFNGNNGAIPLSAVVLDAGGNLFGTTLRGGARDKGIVFEYANSTVQTIYDVCQISKCPEGARPIGGLIQDADGNLFGTNEVGGIKNGGTIFELVNDKPTHHAK